MKSLNQLKEIKGHEGYVTSLLQLPSNDQAFLSSSKDRQLIKWSITSEIPFQLEKVILWTCTVDYIYCSIILQSEQIANSTLGFIYILNYYQGVYSKDIKCLTSKRTPITALAQLQNGYLLSGSWDGNVHLWDLIKEECLNVYKNPIPYKVFSIVPLMNNKQIMITTVDNILLIDVTYWQCDLVIQFISNGEDSIELSNGVIALCKPNYIITLLFN